MLDGRPDKTQIRSFDRIGKFSFANAFCKKTIRYKKTDTCLRMRANLNIVRVEGGRDSNTLLIPDIVERDTNQSRLR